LQVGQRKCGFLRLPHFLQMAVAGSISLICDLLLPCLAVDNLRFGVAAMVFLVFSNV